MEALVLQAFEHFWGLFGLWEPLWALIEPVWPLVWVIIKIVAILVPLMLSVAYLTLAERKVIGYMQVRLGPNRVGPLGLLQPIADGMKLFFKEVIVPSGANKVLFFAAPVLAIAPALAAWAVVPFFDGGALASCPGTNMIRVRTVCLSSYLTEPVDFLKLNIEGAELDVIREAGDTLRNVRRLAIEYHGFPELGERLGELLSRLAAARFRCVVHAFDAATNPAGHPPFRIHAAARWYALIAGTRDVQ